MDKAGGGPIYIGIGANLPHRVHGAPRETLEAALRALELRGVHTTRRSSWYGSAPVPVSDQPWYVNAVVEVATSLPSDGLLQALHAVEDAFGRVRTVANAPRLIDLDLLDFRGEIASGGNGRPVLPHPRMAERAFVLRPLAELDPGWRHPVTGTPVQALLAALPPEQVTRRL